MGFNPISKKTADKSSILYPLIFIRITIVGFILSLVVAHTNIQAQVVTDSSLYKILDSAYAMLRINSAEAERLFEKAVSVDPTNVTIRNQLGYLYHSQKKYELSIEQFNISDSLRSSDTIKLQIAFDLLALNRQTEAEIILQQLRWSKYPDIREASANQLKVLPSAIAAKQWRTHVYLAPYYDTRWETMIYYGNFEGGYYLRDDKKLSALGFLLLSGDGRSKGGLSPIIFSDNVLIFGIGIKAEPLYGLQLKVQQGIAFDLVKVGERAVIRGDFRAIAIYNNGIYPTFSLHDDVRLTLSPLLDVYSSLGYYSRYDNGIWYLQGRGGARMLEVYYSAVDIYLKAGLARDTRKEFYNNLLEGGFGIRLIPNINWGLYLIGEFQRGYYWDIVTTPNRYDKKYNSFRIFIVFDRSF